MSTVQARFAVRNPQDLILFVDDEPIAHKVVKEHLNGWNVEYASSGGEALEILKRGNIQIVIADIVMPGMDGIELIREIKRTNPVIQVILVTASDETRNIMRALEAGASDFLLKPLEKKDLEEALELAWAKISRWKMIMTALFKKREQTRAETTVKDAN